MSRKPLITILIVFLSCKIFAQGKFHITINLDRNIEPRNVRYQYYDGRSLKFVPDTFDNKHTVILSGVYHSPKASFSISYADSANRGYHNEFFLDNKPATISFLLKPNNDDRLDYNYIENAYPIYDTIENKSWARLRSFLSGPKMDDENKAFDAFMRNNRSFATNDSLRRIFNRFYKSRLRHIMSFLKQYPNDYFTYWYFIDQVDQSKSILKPDTAFLREQLYWVENTFPDKFKTSLEGQALLKRLKMALRPMVALNEPAPKFAFKTIDGKAVDIAKLKGRYILLDFWATWCPPCMAQVPTIKNSEHRFLKMNYKLSESVRIMILKH